MGLVIAVLYGAEHSVLDVTAEQAVDDRSAIALSRGRHPKGYAAVDPNEDAALVAAGPTGHLLAVADGHNGVEASHAAMAAIAARTETVVTATGPAVDAIEDLFAAAVRAVDDRVRGLEAPRHRSRTALSVALVTPGTVHAATLGDTTVATVRGGRVRQLGGHGPYLGPRSPVPTVVRARVRAGDLVVVVSDGVTDFAGARWEDALGSTTRDASSAGEVARLLVHRALEGGAGDNVAAAVVEAVSAPRGWRRVRAGAR